MQVNKKVDWALHFSQQLSNRHSTSLLLIILVAVDVANVVAAYHRSQSCHATALLSSFYPWAVIMNGLCLCVCKRHTKHLMSLFKHELKYQKRRFCLCGILFCLCFGLIGCWMLSYNIYLNNNNNKKHHPKMSRSRETKTIFVSRSPQPKCGDQYNIFE